MKEAVIVMLKIIRSHLSYIYPHHQFFSVFQPFITPSLDEHKNFHATMS